MGKEGKGAGVRRRGDCWGKGKEGKGGKGKRKGEERGGKGREVPPLLSLYFKH